ncbi:hypothetical protein ACFL0V_06005 [Nanoarchaeota archaeon]
MSYTGQCASYGNQCASPAYGKGPNAPPQIYSAKALATGNSSQPGYQKRPDLVRGQLPSSSYGPSKAGGADYSHAVKQASSSGPPVISLNAVGCGMQSLN